MLFLFGDTSSNSGYGKLPVLIQIGQSNAVGVAPISSAPAEYQGAIAGAKIWDGADFVDLVAGTSNEGATAADFGPELSLCTQFLAVTGRAQVNLIKYAVSNTSLAVDWLPPSGTQYTTMISTIDAALATLTPGSFYIAGIVWVQGENDALSASATPSNAYNTNLTDFIAAVRSEYGAYGYGGNPNIPFIVAQLGYINRNLYYYQDNVRQAQADVVNVGTNVLMAQTDDLTFNADVIHYDASSQITLGNRAANQIIGISATYIENRPPSYNNGLTYWFDTSTPNCCLDGSNAIVTAGNPIQTALGRQVTPLVNVGQSTANQQPTLTAAIINGRQAATFDGTNDNFILASVNPSLVFGTTAGTVFLVSRVAVNKAQTQVFINAGANALVNLATRWDLGSSVYNFFFDWSNGSGGRLTGASAAVVGTSDIHEFVKRAAGTSQVYRNQVSIGSGSTTGTVASLTGNLRIGYDGSNYFNGNIIEILCYNKELDDAERAQVYTYLNTKYGI